MNAERFNGINQLAYTIPNPTFFPQAGVAIPATATLESPVYEQSSATYHIDSEWRAPTMMQAAIGVDRQLPKNTTLSVNYINSRGEHILQTVDINTPLPGTYNPLNPAASVYPLGAAAGLYELYEPSGDYKQNQLIVNINSRISTKFSLFGYYAYGHVNTDVAGSPSNPYNFHQDYGPASYDIRNRVNINGSLVLPFGLRMSPNITYNSAPPFNVTQGVDVVGDRNTNTRPALAPAGFVAPACTAALASDLDPCLISGGQYGNFVINPQAVGLTPIGINAFRAFQQFQFNVRLSRTWGFGEVTAPNPNRGQGGPGGRGGGPGFGQAAGGGGPRGGGGGGGRGGGGGPPGGGGGGDQSGKRYTLTAGIFVHNLFNNVNAGNPEGDLLSPRFGVPENLANIGGPGSLAFNRRIDLNLRLSF
jgi:hypothetical protein